MTVVVSVFVPSCPGSPKGSLRDLLPAWRGCKHVISLPQEPGSTGQSSSGEVMTFCCTHAMASYLELNLMNAIAQCSAADQWLLDIRWKWRDREVVAIPDVVWNMYAPRMLTSYSLTTAWCCDNALLVDDFLHGKAVMIFALDMFMLFTVDVGQCFWLATLANQASLTSTHMLFLFTGNGWNYPPSWKLFLPKDPEELMYWTVLHGKTNVLLSHIKVTVFNRCHDCNFTRTEYFHHLDWSRLSSL